ncbi:F-box domain-containing protein [Ophiocordyceps camponoti-floridani]|uniref:F-box domain-containing protein n=1 Tax=Ophiocordyceps camponoti-floridani TaxID=2030778 RepID=A0A8H4Q7B6_9HYPO|nr:F-box domain-containing protein [Ophiocordyceps camponoti-floridani]
MKEQTSPLERLSTEILTLIIDHVRSLHHPSVFTLRLACRGLDSLATPVAYRSIHLNEAILSPSAESRLSLVRFVKTSVGKEKTKRFPNFLMTALLTLTDLTNRRPWQRITINVGGWRRSMIRRTGYAWKRHNERGVYAERCFWLEADGRGGGYTVGEEEALRGGGLCAARDSFGRLRAG